MFREIVGKKSWFFSFSYPSFILDFLVLSLFLPSVASMFTSLIRTQIIVPQDPSPLRKGEGRREAGRGESRKGEAEIAICCSLIWAFISCFLYVSIKFHHTKTEFNVPKNLFLFLPNNKCPIIVGRIPKPSFTFFLSLADHNLIMSMPSQLDFQKNHLWPHFSNFLECPESTPWHQSPELLKSFPNWLPYYYSHLSSTLLGIIF